MYTYYGLVIVKSTETIGLGIDTEELMGLMVERGVVGGTLFVQEIRRGMKTS